MAWGFWNKIKNGLKKVGTAVVNAAKKVGKVVADGVKKVVPIAKKVLPTLSTVADVASNFVPGMKAVSTGLNVANRVLNKG